MTKRDTRCKACSRCIRGKRKCDLVHPSCGRCRARGLKCDYVSTRLHRQPLREHPNSAFVPEGDDRAKLRDGDVSMNLQVALDTHSSETDTTRSPRASSTQCDLASDLDRALVAPESWEILNKGITFCDRIKLDCLLAAVSQVQTWLRSWPSTGLLTFNHANIYGADRMPSFLQDAYTACATYYTSSPTTKPQLWRIVERNLDTLVHATGPDAGPCCLVFHLARFQALLIYQTLRLFDGDVRQRLAAESHSALLRDWGHQTLERAIESSSYVKSFPATQEPDHEAAWQAWSLAESIRRTWVVCCVVQGTAQVMKGEEARCPGHLRFTAQMGLWDAKSAYAWRVAQRVMGGVALCESMSGRGMEERARKGELDEFGMWALGVVLGMGVV